MPSSRKLELENFKLRQEILLENQRRRELALSKGRVQLKELLQAQKINELEKDKQQLQQEKQQLEQENQQLKQEKMEAVEDYEEAIQEMLELDKEMTNLKKELKKIKEEYAEDLTRD